MKGLIGLFSLYCLKQYASQAESLQYENLAFKKLTQNTDNDLMHSEYDSLICNYFQRDYKFGINIIWNHRILYYYYYYCRQK